MLSYKNKKVLITGASGFIGSHLTQALLKEGAIVNALSRNIQPYKLENFHTFRASINDLEILKKAAEDTEIIFHLAAQSARYYSNLHPFEDFDTNLNGLINILKVSNGKKIIYPSTSALYTPTKEPILLKEISRIEPEDFYSVSKYASELYLRNFFKHRNIRSTVLRLSFVYGPNQKRGPTYDILTQLSQRKATIELFINPHNVIDLIHVEDVVNAMLLAGLNKESDGEIINISNGKGTKVLDIITKFKGSIEIKNLTTKPFTIQEATNLVLDNTKAKKILNWESKRDLYESLEEIYKSFKNENIKP